MLIVLQKDTVEFYGHLTDDQNMPMSLMGYSVVGHIVDEVGTILDYLIFSPIDFATGRYKLISRTPYKWNQGVNTLVIYYEQMSTGLIVNSVEILIFYTPSDKVFIEHEYNRGILTSW